MTLVSSSTPSRATTEPAEPLAILEKGPDEFSEAEREKAAEEWASLSRLLQTFPQVPNYSQAKTLLRAFLGPLGRFWRRDNIIQAGFEKGGQKFLLGETKTYRDTLIQVAMTMAKFNASVAFGGKNKEAEVGAGQQA